mmetsp:Transcript_56259/g.131116  ORF Transcript_56259/g.131116 Transcript_56259/m.131116 type:complete len:252 (-) Transcript_56259:65-820(-)
MVRKEKVCEKEEERKKEEDECEMAFGGCAFAAEEDAMEACAEDLDDDECPLECLKAEADQAEAAEEVAEQAEESKPEEDPDAEMAEQPQTGASASAGPAVDYTTVPKEMDRQFERFDSDGAVRPTIITPSEIWHKLAQKALLARPETKILQSDEQKSEKDAAFDLLDAITKSGGLPLEHASLHIVVAATHCFEQTVMETVIRENNNPIDRVERSTLIMASTVHQKPAAALVSEAQLPRVSAASPMLFLADA